MATSCRLFTPCGNDVEREMHQQEILKVPSLEQERRHVVFLFSIRSTVSIVISLVNVFVRNNVCTPVLSGLQRSADLPQVLEPAPARIASGKHNWHTPFVQEPIELLDVCEFGIPFADDQIWLLDFHSSIHQIYGNGMPE